MINYSDVSLICPNTGGCAKLDADRRAHHVHLNYYGGQRYFARRATCIISLRHCVRGNTRQPCPTRVGSTAAHIGTPTDPWRCKASTKRSKMSFVLRSTRNLRLREKANPAKQRTMSDAHRFDLEYTTRNTRRAWNTRNREKGESGAIGC